MSMAVPSDALGKRGRGSQRRGKRSRERGERTRGSGGVRGGDQAVEGWGHTGREEPARLACASGTQLLLLAGGRRQHCPWWAGLALASRPLQWWAAR